MVGLRTMYIEGDDYKKWGLFPFYPFHITTAGENYDF